MRTIRQRSVEPTHSSSCICKAHALLLAAARRRASSSLIGPPPWPSVGAFSTDRPWRGAGRAAAARDGARSRCLRARCFSTISKYLVFEGGS
jgi:hypothetical protein